MALHKIKHFCPKNNKKESPYTIGGNVFWFSLSKKQSNFFFFKYLRVEVLFDPEIPLLNIYFKCSQTLFLFCFVFETPPTVLSLIPVSSLRNYFWWVSEYNMEFQGSNLSQLCATNPSCSIVTPTQKLKNTIL